MRGIYLNAWTAGSRARLESLVALASRTEINSFVIDVKDATGYVTHPTQVSLAVEIGADGEVRASDLGAVLERLADAGIYPIARVVVAKDPLLAEARPELAALDSTGGAWTDPSGDRWLNPFQRKVWDYHVAIAREVVEMGFPEIQWDYVRFPDAPRPQLDLAEFPGAWGRTKSEGIRGFLRYARARLADLDVQLTADVFGISTSFRNDVGIGQLWESIVDVADVTLPMVYPSHYAAGSFGFDQPNTHPYEIVRRALDDAVRRTEALDLAGGIRPWLQDFDLGEPPYEAPEVRAQIQAVYDAGLHEWVLWNPASRYTEAALAPLEGYDALADPHIRVGGKVVPSSRRGQVLVDADATAGPSARSPKRR